MVDIVFLGLNDIGELIYNWLTEREDATVRALLTEPEQLDIVEELQPDLVIAGGFRSIVSKDVLAVPDRGAINLHKSYLPHNRGANPNVWSIIKDTQAGVSLHYMTPEVDAGPIIDRREVPVHPDDDARNLYERLEAEQFEQFREVWPNIRDNTVNTVEQDPDAGSYHYKQEFVDMWELDREAEANIGELLDRLRALTFEPYKNAYFEVDGRRYWVEVSITPEGTDREDRDVQAKSVPEYTENGDN